MYRIQGLVGLGWLTGPGWQGWAGLAGPDWLAGWLGCAGLLSLDGLGWLGRQPGCQELRVFHSRVVCFWASPLRGLAIFNLS